jgi:hypothetical protein
MHLSGPGLLLLSALTVTRRATVQLAAAAAVKGLL